MSIQDEFDYIFKVVVIGDSGAGKTSLIKQFSLGEFDKEMRSTLGVELFVYNNEIADKKIRTQIWDTAGQERFKAVTNLYYSEAQIHIDPDACVILLGNKSDLRHLRAVTRDEAEQFAKKHDINFLEVSAKDNANVKYGFESLISEIYHLHSFKQTEYECRQIQNGSVTLTSAQPYNAASISQEKLKQMREKCCS